MIEPLFSSFLALLTAFFWGLNSHLVRIGVKDQNVFFGFFIRAIVTSPILLIIAYFISNSNVIQIYFSFNEITIFLAFSVILIVIGDSFFMLALKEFKVNVIMPIAAIYPLITTSILIITGTESITSLVLLGTIFIILGVSVVTRFGTNGETGLREPVSQKAISYAIIAAMSWGTSVFFVKLILTVPNTDPISLNGFRTFFMGLLSISIYFLFFKKDEKLNSINLYNKRSLTFLALSGIVGWVLGSTTFFIAVQNIGASIPTPISSMNPIIAVIIGYVFKIESISIKQFIGVFLSVFGTILIVL